MPYLGLIKIGVRFDNISINTDGQMTDGTVETDYDADFATGDNAGSTALGKPITTVNTRTEQAETEPSTEAETAKDIATVTEAKETDMAEGSEEVTNTENNDTAADDTAMADAGGPNSGDSSEPATEEPAVADNTGNEPDADTDPDSSEEAGAVVIEYRGNEYHQGDVVQIPFSEAKEINFFKLNNAGEDAKIRWSKHKDLNTPASMGFAGNGNEIFIENLHQDISGALEAQYWPNGHIEISEPSQKIRVQYNIIREPFEIRDLWAKHKTNRLAGPGETLYILKHRSPAVQYESVRFDTNPTNGLTAEEISSNDLHWYYIEDGVETQLNNDGKLNWQASISRSNSLSYGVRGGVPNLNSKEKEIKFVDNYNTTYSRINPIVSNFINDLFNNKINKISRYLPSAVDLSATYEESEQQYNEEDKNSNLIIDYENSSYSAGIGASVDLPIPGLAYQIPYVGTLGGYIGLSANFSGQYTLERTKKNTESQFKTTAHSFGPTGTFCLELGAKLEFLPGVEEIKLEAKAYGKACLVFEAAIEINEGAKDKLTYDISFNPLIGGISGELNVGGFELFKQSREWHVFDKVDITNGELELY